MLEDKEIIKFNELKTKQCLCMVWLSNHKQIAYTQNEIALMGKVLKVEENLERVNTQIHDFCVKNESFLKTLKTKEEIKKIFENPKFRVKMERQKELSKEVLDFETTVEDLVNDTLLN